jgi:hypothetical protein
VEDHVLKAVLTFLAMVVTTCLAFAAVGVLSWQMALAVLTGSAIGAALARVRLSPAARRPAQ